MMEKNYLTFVIGILLLTSSCASVTAVLDIESPLQNTYYG